MKHKTLIFYLQIAFCFLLLSNFTTPATSHSPSDLHLSYNTDTTTLTATFKHSVFDASTHYVDSVEIKLNEVIVETLYYTSQPTTNEFAYEYNISASEGDEFLVTGFCNQGGNIIQYLTIGNSTISTSDLPDDGTNGNEDDPSVPGFNFSIILISSMGIFFIIFTIIKKKMKVIR